MKKIFHLSRGGEGGARDVRSEIELHIEQRTREFIASGMTPDDARRAAIAAFGDPAAIESQVTHLHESTIRDRQRRDWFSEMRQDLRVGLRGLRRAPVFAIVAILTLALGIGANTAVFSVVRSVLLRPLPYENPHELVQVWSDHRALGREQPEWLSPPDFIDWRNDNRTFAAMAAYQNWLPSLTGSGEPLALAGFAVSGNYFDLLRTRPALGRLLTMQDDDPAAEPVVVLGHALWRGAFGGDSSVISRTITLSGSPWTVVGVLSPTFHAPLPASADLYRPIRRPANSGCGRACITVRAIGRLKAGVTVAEAQADLAGIAERIAREFPASNDKVGAWLVPLQQQITGQSKAALFALTGAVMLVLLIACVNLANLLLVRGAGRARELSMRAVLGAGHWRIARQLLTENALLAIVGGALGVIVGIGGSRVLASLVPDAVRSVQVIRVDGQVLIFAATLTLVSGAIFGLFPAWQAVRANFMASLRSGARETGRGANAMRSGLVVAQLALAVVLLVGAGLLLRSFLLMQQVDLGFRSEGVVLAPVGFPVVRYQTGAQLNAAINDVLARVRRSPAVRSVELTDRPPLTAGDQDVSAFPIGEPPLSDGPNAIWYRSITPGYFDAMRVRLVAGRQFTSDDREGALPVGIINEDAARRFWPGKDPVGREVANDDAPDAQRVTIVGVVASGRHDGPNEPFKAELFRPVDQLAVGRVTFVLEPAAAAADAVGALREGLKAVDPLIPVANIQSIDEFVGETVALPRLYAKLVGTFAAAALLLAVLGVYGVMAYAVSQRQREIGVRLALGAAPSGIRRMVLRQGGRLALLGVGLGLAASLAVGQLIDALLFGVTAFDAPTLIAVSVVLGAMTLFASWIPARRAMRVDPLSAIRQD